MESNRAQSEDPCGNIKHDNLSAKCLTASIANYSEARKMVFENQISGGQSSPPTPNGDIGSMKTPEVDFVMPTHSSKAESHTVIPNVKDGCCPSQTIKPESRTNAVPEQKCPTDLSCKEPPGKPCFTSPDESKPAESTSTEMARPGMTSSRGLYHKAIYDKALDPESLKQKRKKRAVELKLKNLKWTLNQPSEVTGKRQKKAPDRFELALLSKRKTSMDDAEGTGDPLGSIPWIVQHIRDANIYTLRLLHRVIFRKQGMFSEKHIRRSVLSFRGFPFDFTSSEVEKRKMPLEKASVTSIARLCDILGIKSGDKPEMINNILKFLHNPSRQQVENYLKDVASTSVRPKDVKDLLRLSAVNMIFPPMMSHVMNLDESSGSSHGDAPEMLFTEDSALLNSPWKKPPYFVEGTGMKLKSFKPIVANIQVATYSFIEKLHRLLYLECDTDSNMRRNILEFSGFRSIVGTTDYVCRTKLLYELPVDQIKLICRVLCLPTWHRSRQFLVDGILNFLTAPCLGAMKKTVPPPTAVPVSKGNALPLDMTKKLILNDVRSLESEEIEIVPDIHIPDNDYATHGKDLLHDPLDDIEVKLKNFPNIHYQVISTPASKLNDLHLVLYGRPCPLNNIRKNILDFTRFPFGEMSVEYQSRKSLLQQMNLDSLITIVTVLSLTPYVVDLSRQNIVEAVLKFLLKPAHLLNSSGQMVSLESLRPSDIIRPVEPIKAIEPMKNLSVTNIDQVKNKVNLELLEKSGEITIQPINYVKAENQAVPHQPPQPAKPKDGASKRKSQPPVKMVAKSPPRTIKEEKHDGAIDLDEPLAKVKRTAQSVIFNEQLFESDENDDEPLSKFIGHPNDDQLRTLITKIIKESRLEDITMKQVIRTVFNAYPNYDLAYRKEFIKSVVRQLLSQMDEQRCSVSTTVLTF